MMVVASVPFPTVADAQNRFISIKDIYLFIKAQNSHNFDALSLQFSKTEGIKNCLLGTTCIKQHFPGR